MTDRSPSELRYVMIRLASVNRSTRAGLHSIAAQPSARRVASRGQWSTQRRHPCLRTGKRAAMAQIAAERAPLWQARHVAPQSLTIFVV